MYEGEERDDEYDRSLLVEMPDEGDGIRRFVRLRYSREGGRITRCMIGYEIEVNGVRGQIKRFDNFHDNANGFHEHPVGWPQCPSEPKTSIVGVVPNQMLAHGRQEVKNHDKEWENQVLRGAVMGIED